LEPIRIDLIVGGLRDVDRAFESVQQRIARLEKANEQAATRGAQARVKAAQGEAAERKVAADQIATGLEKSEGRATGAAVAGSHERTRAAKLEARRRQSIIENSASYAGRYAAQQANAEIREAKRATKAIEREHRKRAHKMLHATIHGTGERFGRLAEMGGAILGIGAGFELADIARERLASQRIAAKLSVLGRGQKGSSVNEIIGKAGEVGIATGTKKNDLINAALQFTGSLGSRSFEGGQRNLEFFAKMSKVTGKDVGEVANVAANLVRENKGISDQDMRRSMLATLSPGAFGRATSGDVGQMVAKIESTRGAFSGPASEVQRQMLTLGQLGFDATGNAKQTAAAVGGLSKKALTDKKGALKALGINVGEAGIEGTPMQFVENILKGSHGNISTIAKALGAAPATLFEGEHGLAATYRAAEAAKKGSGISAVQAQVSQAGAGLMTEEDLDKNFSEVMDTAAEKFDKAVNTVKEVIETRLAPFIDRLADRIANLDVAQIEKFVGAVGDVVDYLISNPWTGIGAAVTASITADIVGAKLGELVTKTMVTNLAEAGIGMTIGAALAALIAGIDIGEMISDYALHGQSDTAKAQSAGLLEAVNAESDLRGGKMSPDEIKKRIEKIQQLKEQAGDSNVAQDVVGAVAAIYSPDTADTEARAKAASTVQMEVALRDLTLALKANTEANKKPGEGGGKTGLPAYATNASARDTNMGRRGGADQ
jgi:ElaB/YqjD/DUF883 family membrane-anchored ribosome-binding protein